MSVIEIKVVIVGDGMVGKTSILMVRSQGHMPTESSPTIFDNFDTEVCLNGQQVKLNIMDVNGTNSYVNVRPLAYADTNVFLMCYSYDSSRSLSNIMDHWLPEVRQFCPNVPIILVGNKIDLVDIPDKNTSQIPPTTEEALKVSKKLKPFAHIECSAVTKQGIDDIFIAAARAALQPNKAQAKCCVVS